MLYQIRLLVLLLAFSSGGVVAEQNAEEYSIKPNQEVQSLLQALSSTNAQERQKMFPAGTEEEFKETLISIQEKAGGVQELVRQLLYFSAHAQDTRQGMLPLVLVEQLNISEDDRVAAIVPLLNTGDQSVLKQAYEWLQVVNFDSEAQEFRFSRHENVLRRKSVDVPKGLIKYMYAKSPDAALSSLANVYLGNDEAKALVDQVKGEGNAHAVQRLSQRPEWWAHLYVAAMMEKDPSLRTPELVEKLETDTNPLVRDKVSKLKDQLHADIP